MPRGYSLPQTLNGPEIEATMPTFTSSACAADAHAVRASTVAGIFHADVFIVSFHICLSLIMTFVPMLAG